MAVKQVTIIGLGLIGTSLGLALKRASTPPRVVGNDTQYDAATRATRLKAVDSVERDLSEAVSGSDMVVIATPVGSAESILGTVSPALAAGSIVTDTGSTKREVVELARKILPSTVSFVGGHPMTGKATAGVEQPDAALFANTVYCLTPTALTPEAAVAEVASMVQRIGASTYFLDPVEHDGLVAGISHLPYLVSATLMRVLASQASWKEMSELAAGGFEVATRLATGDPKMFADIVATNSDNVARYLDEMIAQLTRTRDRIVEKGSAVQGELEAAQRLRLRWEEQRRKAQEQRR